MADEYPGVLKLRSLAKVAGDRIRDHFTHGFMPGVESHSYKADGTIVTPIDLWVNGLVIRVLERDFPRVSVIAEEGSRIVSGSKHRVLCDPLDGTVGFCCGIPFFSFCIAVLEEHEPLAAVIYDPMMGRMWHAERGKGAFMNEDQISVSAHKDLRRAKVSCVSWRGARGNIQAVRNELYLREAEIVSPQSIAYMGGLLAEGKIDATVFGVRRAFETAAMHLIVEEAGGKVTDIHGNKMFYGENGEIQGHIISNGLLHDHLVELVKGCQLNC